MYIWFWGMLLRLYGSSTMFQESWLDPCSTLEHQTWSNDQSQHDLLCGGVSLSISFNLKLAQVPYATLKWPIENFKKSLGCMCILIKFSYGPCTRKPFARKVMSSVLSLLILNDFLLSSVALWSSFAFVCKHYISLSTTKSNTFFYCPS